MGRRTFKNYVTLPPKKSRMTLTKKTLHKIAVAVLLLFVFHQFITIFYTHAHNVKGYMVVHSHPFSKTSDTEHTHTLYEFQIIGSGMVLLTLLSFLGLLPDIFIQPVEKYGRTFIHGKFRSLFYRVLRHRGPPVVSVI